MKILSYVPEYPRTEADSRFTLRAVAGYLIPDSFSNWVGVMLLTFLASWAGVVLGQFVSAGADILWPPNGLLLAILLRAPRRNWSSYLACSVVANIAVHLIYPFAIGQTLMFSAANVVEIMLAASWLSRDEQWNPDLTRMRSLAAFALYGVLLAPLAATVFLEANLMLFSKPARWLALSNWLLGDMMGIAIMTPLVLAMDRTEISALLSRTRRLETIGILAGIGILSYWVFAQPGLPIVFVLFPVLLLAIFRLGSSGAAIGLFLMAAPAAYFTARQGGPFSPAQSGSINHSVFLLQGFLGVSLVTIYSVSAALAKRDRLAQELTTAYQKADAHAGLDHLTGLANRRTFDQRMTREWKRALREQVSLSLLMIDVDYFKSYNDRYGHLAGDACLKTVAAILAKAPLRDSDLIARYGGEEFAVILPRASLEGASIIADLIRQSIADANLTHFASLSGIVTVSVGVATMHPEEATDQNLLILHADSALYQAKRAGRNRVFVWRNQAHEGLDAL